MSSWQTGQTIAYCPSDRSFQVYSDQIADWFSEHDYRVDKPGKMHDIHQRSAISGRQCSRRWRGKSGASMCLWLPELAGLVVGERVPDPDQSVHGVITVNAELAADREDSEWASCGDCAEGRRGTAHTPS
ncbi:MAG: hypothetical protein A2Y93_10630 [Chloroflexi bacterium RBG_13_68_17]|nr:MAG: hypothetical protein A2Y93_10630 [Chloroflexi bacterium RBG_13_68_17]